MIMEQTHIVLIIHTYYAVNVFLLSLGIFCDYVLQTTFFVAWLSIDARR